MARSLLLSLCTLFAAGCLSSAPPAPPVRWFDLLALPVAPGAPASPRASGAAKSAGRTLQVVAAPHLGKDWVLRVGERELAFDADHRWLTEPAAVLSTMLQRAGVVVVADGGDRTVLLEVFELDRRAAALARIVAQVVPPRDAAGAVVGEAETLLVEVPARASSVEACAGAMAEAVAVLVARLLASE